MGAYSNQDLQDMTALAMGTTGFSGVYKDRWLAVLQERGLTPRGQTFGQQRPSGVMVSFNCLEESKSGNEIFVAVIDPCSLTDYNALRPRLSTKGAQSLLAKLGELDNIKELQDVVQTFFNSGQMCHVVVTRRRSSNDSKSARMQVIGVYPTHSPVLASTKAAISKVERSGLKFRLATAASQNYAHLVGGAIQTPGRRLSHAPLLEASLREAWDTPEARHSLVRQVINHHGGMSRCGSLTGGKALLIGAAREVGYSNIMFGDGSNDVDAMRAADVAIGAGLHSHWGVIDTADVLVGINTSKQDISGLGDLLDGSHAATLRIVRYLETLHLTHIVSPEP